MSFICEKKSIHLLPENKYKLTVKKKEKVYLKWKQNSVCNRIVDLKTIHFKRGSDKKRKKIESRLFKTCPIISTSDLDPNPTSLFILCCCAHYVHAMQCPRATQGRGLVSEIVREGEVREYEDK